MKLVPTSETFKTIDFGLLAIRQTTQGLRKSLGKNLRADKQRDQQKAALDARIIDSKKKRDAEKITEKRTPAKFIKGGMRKAVAKSKSIFEGLLTAAGYLVLDWLLANLPKVIAVINDVTDFVKSFVKTVTTAFENFVKLLKELKDVFVTFGKMVADLDFSEKRREELKKEFDDFVKQGGKLKDDLVSGFEETSGALEDLKTQSRAEVNEARKQLGMAPLEDDDTPTTLEQKSEEDTRILNELSSLRRQLDAGEIDREEYARAVNKALEKKPTPRVEPTVPAIRPRVQISENTSERNITASSFTGQTGLPPLPPTGTLGTGAQQYGAARSGGRKHAGQDYDISGDEKFYSRIGGVVIYAEDSGGAGGDGTGYGNIVDIYNADYDVIERISEGRKILVKEGDSVMAGQAVMQGEDIRKSDGQIRTGVIHYEIRPGRTGYSGGFENTIDPVMFLKGIEDGTVKPKTDRSTSSLTGTPSREIGQLPSKSPIVLNVPFSVGSLNMNGGGNKSTSKDGYAPLRSSNDSVVAIMQRVNRKFT
jgi:septal ring factor EnvC (AmiA/AmiB activator)